ncbi:MAG: galactose-1-phosphate uridylyltransferase [Candidatus Sumerlaeia bacterium]
MSMLRKDPVSGGWVIMAREVIPRPPALQPINETETTSEASCPFCEGNERMTPPEIWADRAGGMGKNGRGWQLRVIPNKFALLRIEGEVTRSGEGIYDMVNGVGAHEVIIESPRHNARMAHYKQARMESVVRTWRDRMNDLYRDQRFRYVQIFRNYGQSAGSRIFHAHSQIMALPITPRWIADEMRSTHEYYEYKERCLFCDIIQQEIKANTRVVAINEGFIAIEPFAARFPFETWILPRRHSHDFQFLTDGEIPALAAIMKQALGSIEQALQNPPFNLVIHSAPQAKPTDSSGLSARQYHWHMEIIPRLTTVAGFEWGTGFHVNPTLPEEAADFLKQVIDEGHLVEEE